MRTSDRGLKVRSSFDLDPDQALPDLAGVGGVASTHPEPVQRSTTTYFDSEDLRLARAGVTLRRRTGGGDAGWQLRLQDHVEVRRPAGRSGSNVPVELAGLVRARLGGAALGAVARVQTSRRVTRLLAEDGTVLAEVADDSTTAERVGAPSRAADNGTGAGSPLNGASASWREVAVETPDGLRPLLTKVGRQLRRGGARRSAAGDRARALTALMPAAMLTAPAARPELGKRPSSGAVALAHLTGQVDELIRRDPQVRLDLDDSVHRMRVATRRLRSALATFGPLFEVEPVAQLRAELAWLAGLLGVARDAEVMRERLASAVAALPPDAVVGPVVERIRAEFDTAYRDGHDQVVAALNGRRYQQLLAALDAFVADPPVTDRAARPAIDQVYIRVRHTLRRVERALGAAQDAPNVQAQDLLLHEVRKAAKRARYAGEAVTGVFGDPARAYATRMKAVHELLGAHQDALLARQALADLAGRAHQAGESAFSYGLLSGLEACGAADADTALAASTTVIRKATHKWPR